MKNIFIYIPAVAILSVFSGCAELSKPVDIDKVLLNLNDDLQRAGLFSISDLLQNSTKANAEHKVFCAIYRGHSQNPTLQIIDQSFNLELTGIFTAAGKFGVSAIGAMPTATLEFDPTKAQQQSIKFPVTYVSLESLPDVYMKQKLLYINAIPDKDKYDTKNKLPLDPKKIDPKATREPTQKEIMIDNLLTKRNDLEREITHIRAVYGSQKNLDKSCGKDSTFTGIPSL